MDPVRLVCELDGVPTRLRCAECEKGICPACQVRTAVGFKCRKCAGVALTAPTRRPAPLLIGGVVVLVLAVAVVLLRPGSRPTVDPVGTPAVADSARPNAQAMIGEEARDGQLAFVIDDFGCGPKPESGAVGKLCTLRLTVRNISGSPAMFLGRFQYLVDGSRRTYGADDALSRPQNGNRSLSEMTVNPDVVVPLVLLYDLPDAVEPVEAQFKGTGRSRFGVNVRLERR